MRTRPSGIPAPHFARIDPRTSICRIPLARRRRQFQGAGRWRVRFRIASNRWYSASGTFTADGLRSVQTWLRRLARENALHRIELAAFDKEVEKILVRLQAAVRHVLTSRSNSARLLRDNSAMQAPSIAHCPPARFWHCPDSESNQCVWRNQRSNDDQIRPRDKHVQGVKANAVVLKITCKPATFAPLACASSLMSLSVK